MSDSPHYHDLGPFSDWVAEAQRQQALYPPCPPGPQTQARVRAVLGFSARPEEALDLRVDATWETDGLSGETLSWSVGYGPRTQAWLLKPGGATGPLPGIVALHCHGGFKYAGKEKIAQGPDEAPAYIRNNWARLYGGRPFANALAREGFAVLVPDVFLWGSRRFPMDTLPEWAPTALTALQESDWLRPGTPHEVGAYNFAAAQHEHVIEKYCHVLGTTLAGVIAHEDRISVNVLRARSDVDPARIGCIGLSGGGGRSALLQATHNHIRAAVVVGMMASYPGLLDRHIVAHTWMLFPAGWARHGDWPDLAACRAPSPLLVQYDRDDELFSPESMQAADTRLAQHYRAVGAPDAYRGEFYPGPHKFDMEMQESAFAWLKARLGA
jgi:dienelactone hydrolase